MIAERVGDVTPMLSRPYEHSATDSIGAGWECSYEMSSLRGLETSAYALCQVVARPR